MNSQEWDDVMGTNPEVTWSCNNPECTHTYTGIFFDPETHLPDTDCPTCGWHDAMVETK